MSNRSLSQCSRALNFAPRLAWPAALPAFCWKSLLLTGFERSAGHALDLHSDNGCNWVDAVKACYPNLGLAEAARLLEAVRGLDPAWHSDVASPLCAQYGWHWNERLQEILRLIASTPIEFQGQIDARALAARDLAPLLALDDLASFHPFLLAIGPLGLSKSEHTRALELAVELVLLQQPLNLLLPATGVTTSTYLQHLEGLRRPRAASVDRQRQQTVRRWPWPAHVQGKWQRFGDQSGLEIRIQTTSPQDFAHKLQRLADIREAWACNP